MKAIQPVCVGKSRTHCELESLSVSYLVLQSYPLNNPTRKVSQVVYAFTRYAPVRIVRQGYLLDSHHQVVRQRILEH